MIVEDLSSSLYLNMIDNQILTIVKSTYDKEECIEQSSNQFLDNIV